MSKLRAAAYINLDNAIYNMESMHNNLSKDTKMMAVIKTNGYGHGAVELAKKLTCLPYLYGFAVATAEEAIELRDNGITKPILILGYVFEDDYELLIKNDVSFAVFMLSQAEAINDVANRLNKEASIHIKVDTGMGRIGFNLSDEAIKEVAKINELENIKIDGIFTHFAKADMTDHEPTYRQIENFKGFIERCEKEGISFPIKHCSNSAGIIDFKDANFDMVRAGITLYGLWPSDEVSKNIIDLKPLMSLKSHIAYIKNVDKGTAISYGGTYVTDEERRIATIPVGYGDGYPRSLSNKGFVLIRGKKAPIVGRVCMDQFMVDVTNIPDVAILDEVTLIGRDGDEEITMELLGDMSGRFNYELACDVSKRVARIYS